MINKFISRLYTKFVALFLLLFVLAQVTSQSNVLGLVVILIIIVLWLSMSHYIDSWGKKHFKNRIIWFFIGLLLLLNTVVTISIVLFFRSVPVSDPLNALIKATELYQGNFNWHISHVASTDQYFFSYPNTVPYTIILSKVVSAFSFLNIGVLSSFRVFNTILIAASNYILVATIYIITKNTISTLKASFIVLLVPVLYLYPNVVVYSDTVSIFIFSTIFFISAILFCHKSKVVLSISAISLVFVFGIGYAIKSNIIILIPAILIILIISFVTKKEHRWRSLVVLASISVGFILAIYATPAVEQSYGYRSEDTKLRSLPPTHWINMGLNVAGTNGPGSYDLYDDNTDRQAVVNNDSKFIADTIKNRCHSLSIFGLINLWAQKFKILMGAPLFGFGKYQSGWFSVPSLYARHQGAIDYLLNTVSAGIIVAIVFRILILVIIKRKTFFENSPYYFFVITSAIGLSMFHTFVWETEPRYFLPMLLPLLLLDALPNTIVLPAKYGLHKKMFKLSTCLWLITFLSLIVISQTTLARFYGGANFGNSQYDARIPLRSSIVMKNSETFMLRVPSTGVYDLHINIPVTSSRIVRVNGVRTTAAGDHYELTSYFKRNMRLKVEISGNKNSDPVFLYRSIDDLDIYSGSTISAGNGKYFLPYTLHLQDKQQSPNFYKVNVK